MSLLQKYYRIDEAAGVSVHIYPDGQTLFQLVTIVASGNKLDIDKKVVDIDSIKKIKDQLAPKSAIALNLSGKGILQKQIEKTENIDQANFNKVLPNGNFNDFYVQNFISGQFSFVSIIRKADADKLINQFSESGLNVLMLSLGPFPADHVIPQLNIYEGNLTFNGHVVKRNEKGDWINYQYSEKAVSPFPIKIESETIHEKLLISYAAAFQLVLTNQIDPVCANAEYLEDALQKKLAINKLKVQGFIVLIVLFVLLLANFIALSWLNSSNTALTNQASLYAQSTSTLQQLNEQVQKKEGLLHTLGWEDGINKSALIDQICSLLPEEIKLTEIAVDPVDQAGSRAEKSMVFRSRKIKITGVSDKIIPVNEWIARVKTRAWVKNVGLESYTYDNELNTGRFLVTINY